MYRILRVLALFSAVVFTSNVFAAGYTCDSIKQYTSCSSGYYMTYNGSYNGTPQAGNTCTKASAGCTAAGGTANQVCCTSDCTYGATRSVSCGTLSNGSYTGTQTCNATKNSVSGCYTWGGTTGCARSCNANYYLNGTSCSACSSVSFTDSGTQSCTDTSGCTSTSQTVTLTMSNGSYKQDQTRSGSRTGSQSKSRTCYRTTSSAGSTASSQCTGSANCGSYTYGACGNYGNCSYTAWSNSGSAYGHSCNSGYYLSGTTCYSCTGVSFTDSGTDTGTDTSGCTSTSQTVTVAISHGSYKQNQTRSGSRSWSQSKSRTCYRTGGAGGTNGSSACTGASCGSYSYGTKSYGTCSYSAWSNSGSAYGYSCDANYYLTGTTCTACNVSFTDYASCTYTVNITGGVLSYSSGTKSRTCYHTSSSAGSTSSSQCTGTANCGSYGSCGSGTLSSVHCNAGYYKNTSNTCTSCPIGSYCPGGDFTPSSSNAGLNSCSNAPANSNYTGSATTNACPWSCNAGYYGSSANGNTSCAACGSGNYCTGGTHRAACSTTVKSGAPTPNGITSLSSGSWNDREHGASANDCICDWYFSDETRIQYLNQGLCSAGPSGSNYTHYNWCRTGYYAADPLNFNEWYNSCTACTNKPSNSSYTSYSTPSTMYAVEDNCPWQCNANYYKNGSACAACSGVSFTDSGTQSCTDTSGCTATSQTVTVSITNGSYKQNQVRSGSRTGSQSKSRTCYRTTSPAGSTASSQCTGSANCGSYSYGACGSYGNCSYTAWSNSGNPYGYSCDAGFYWNGSACTKCTAGYKCPGFSGVDSPTNGTGREKCTGTTYSGEGASSCTSCPNSATGYWISGDIHTTINSCWKTVSYTASHGSGVQNCYYTSGSGTSAVYSSSCDTKTIQACHGGYYYNSSSSTTDCIDVGNGYYRAASEAITTRNSCTSKVGATYTASDNGRDEIGDCYQSCSKACTQQACPSTASSCSHGSSSTTGTQHYGASCTAAASSCSLTVNGCKANYFKEGNACTTCPSGYPYADAGTTASGKCYKNSTKYGGRNNAALPTGCAVQTQNECTLNSCTYRTYADGTTSSCTVSNCDNTHKACTSASVNYYLASGVAKACSGSYPNSAGGNIDSNSCYGTFSKSGNQLEPAAPAVPSGCATRTYSTSACAPGSCDYTKYASGTIKTDCTPTNCTKGTTITGVTADANHYVSGITCPSCPVAYPLSDGGAISDANCYVSKTNTGSQITPSSAPTNCYSVSEWNSCTPGTCNWRDYKSATDTTCTPDNCTKTAKVTTGKSGYYGYTGGNGGACGKCSDASSTYTLSDNGAANASWCYRNQTNTGTISRTNASCVTNSCAYNTCSCTPGTCTWKDYNGATDTTCTPENCSCTNSVKSWTGDSGYYFNGSSMAKCVAGNYCAGFTVTSVPTNGVGQTVCGANSYSDAGAAACTACDTTHGYGNSGSTAANHASVASCRVTCGGGQYVATASAGCVNVGAGYWGAGGTVAQNATLARTACATGLTTIGYGAGADEAADCGRILNAGDRKVYLRSVKKTTPSLNVKIGDTTYYGNMTSGALDGYLIIKDGNVTYRVHDDSKQ